MRLYWLAGALALALRIGAAALQVPRPAGAGAPPTAFSAERAMADVRELAQRPHPIGSADHARVRDVLLRRMTELGLQTSTQSGPISRGSARHLRRIDPETANFTAINLIGVLPGRDPALIARRERLGYRRRATPCPGTRPRKNGSKRRPVGGAS